MPTKTKKAVKRKVTKPKPKPKVKKKAPPKTFQCGKCFKPGFVLKKSTFRTDTGKLLCLKCEGRHEAPPEPVKVTKKAVREQMKAEVEEKLGWYVLQVEPGMESRVRKDIIRRSKIDSLERWVKRLLVPRKFEEVVLAKKGVEVARGEEGNQRVAVMMAQRKASELCGQEEGEVGPDGASATPGYRYSVFRSPGKEKGREGNGFTWTVKTVPPEREKKVIKIVKYPGYVICNLAYTTEVAKAVQKVRNQWGFLMRPVRLGHRVKVKTSKAVEGRWNWSVREPEHGHCVAKGREWSEARARQVAEGKKGEIEAFRPTRMKTKEAAELLVAQKAVNQISKDKEEMNRAILSFRAGDKVLITEPNHPFRGCTGTVKGIDKSNKAEPTVTITGQVIGVDVEITARYWEVKRA